jgi:hypothetical protein
VAVNVELEEADLTQLDVEELVASVASRTAEVGTPLLESPGVARLKLEDQERRQSLWRLLLLTAFVLLGLETLISNRISRVEGKRGYNVGT